MSETESKKACMESLTERTREFVRKELANMEGSHDFFHIQRVYNTTMALAEAEKLSEQEREIAGLGALLHDISDWKYSGSEESGPEKAAEFLRSQDCDAHVLSQVVLIIKHVSFHSELGGANVMFPALAVVQDADRLDAIGAIGIARCFAFGGSKKRALYDPENPPQKDLLAKEKYMASSSASVNHFYEKLLLLKGMLKTEAGRKVAEERHKYMEEFLDRFFLEWDGKA